jgi:hypothetical protein
VPKSGWSQAIKYKEVNRILTDFPKVKLQTDAH